MIDLRGQFISGSLVILREVGRVPPKPVFEGDRLDLPLGDTRRPRVDNVS